MKRREDRKANHLREMQARAQKKYSAKKFDKKEEEAVEELVKANSKGLSSDREEAKLKKIRQRTCKVATSKAMTSLMGETKFEYNDLVCSHTHLSPPPPLPPRPHFLVLVVWFSMI
jgi:hypothetical protein